MTYMHIWTSPDNQKESDTTPESMACACICQKNENAPNSGQLLNTNDSDSVKQEKKRRLFHFNYLDKLPG